MDFEDTCIPKSQREASFTIAALHQWEMDIDDDRCIDSAEEVSIYISPFFRSSLVHLFLLQWIAGTLKPVHVGGPFPSVSPEVSSFGSRVLMFIYNSLHTYICSVPWPARIS